MTAIWGRGRWTTGALAAAGAAVLLLATGCAPPPGLGTPPVFYPVSGGVATGWATTDVNGDGASDFVVLDKDTDTVTVLLNDGAGAMATAETPWPVDMQAPGEEGVHLGDFTSDGHPDVLSYGHLVASPTTAGTFLSAGDGDGGFGPPTLLSVVSGTVDEVADLNGDGNLDLLDGFDGGLVMSLGDGAGGFGPASPIVSFPYPGGWVDGVGVGDVNGDNHPDLSVSGTRIHEVCRQPDECWFEYSGFVQHHLGDGLGGFAPPVGGGFGDVLADFDEDGDVDYAGGATQSVIVWLGDGTGHFPTSTSTPVDFPLCSLATGDFDGDGHVDLVTSAQSNHGRILYGDGTGGFPRTQILHSASNSTSQDCNLVSTGQLDGAGKTDVAFLSTATDRVAVLLNTQP